MASSLADHMRSGVRSGLGLLRAIGQRMAVHFLAILAVGLITTAAEANPFPLWTFEESFATYVGLVCLLPRGDWRSAEWLAPTLAGLVQMAVLWLLGMPWLMTIFWGGLQTWTLRCLLRLGGMGWEWTASPFLLCCLCVRVQDALLRGEGLAFLWTLAAVALCGWAGFALYRKLRATALVEKQLDAALTRLRRSVDWKALPENVQRQATLLLSQAASFRQVWAQAPEGRPIIEKLDDISKTLEELAGEARALAGKGGNALARGILRSSRWQKLAAPTPKLDKCAADMRECNALLLDALRRGKTEAADSEDADTDRLNGFAAAAQDLLGKKEALPPHLRQHVESIAAAALDMVEDMRKDAADRPAGCKFLRRYLPAAHKIADDYARLAAGEHARQEDVAAALQRTDDVLARLAVAFADEKAGMLQNDAINYTAELNALDAMLQMRGK